MIVLPFAQQLLMILLKIISTQVSEHGQNLLFFCTRCKSEQPLQCLVLQENEEENDQKHLGELFRKNPKIKGVY